VGAKGVSLPEYWRARPTGQAENRAILDHPSGMRRVNS
jgi:hypothetical protein